MRSARALGALVVLAVLVPGAHADKRTDTVQMGIGMGAVGALIGSTAGATGAAVGGIVGVGVGAAMANTPGRSREDPAHARALEAERASWQAQRQASEERLRDEQRVAFERRLAASGAAGVDPATPVSRSVLEQGRPGTAATSSALVVQIQRALMRKGYEPGAADGVVTPATVTAIEAYQRDHRLPRTGEPSMALLEHLRQEGG